MRWVTATALLVVLGATPALALLCEARCAAPHGQSHAQAAGDATHAHHAHAVPASNLQTPGSGLQASGLLRNCTPHVAADVVAPERLRLVCGSPEPSEIGLAGAVRGSGSQLLHVIRPPLLVPRPSAPLRI